MALDPRLAKLRPAAALVPPAVPPAPDYGDLAAVAEAEDRMEGEWGEERYHEGMVRLAGALEPVLVVRTRAAGPEEEVTSMQVVYALQDELQAVGLRKAADDVYNRMSLYDRIVQTERKRMKNRARRGMARAAAVVDPRYEDWITERARLRRQLAAETRQARSDPSFRMMGGLHTLGVTARTRIALRQVEKKIADVEKRIPSWGREP